MQPSNLLSSRGKHGIFGERERAHNDYIYLHELAILANRTTKIGKRYIQPRSGIEERSECQRSSNSPFSIASEVFKPGVLRFPASLDLARTRRLASRASLVSAVSVARHSHCPFPITQATLIQTNTGTTFSFPLSKGIFSGLIHDCESMELHTRVYPHFYARHYGRQAA